MIFVPVNRSPAATTGRAYRRAVDTFLCPAALVAESDRREAVEANEVDDINVFDESGLSEKQVAVKQVEVQTSVSHHFHLVLSAEVPL
jgi:hypothetical protein